MQVLKVNNDRYLINPLSSGCEDQCNKILQQYDSSAVVDFCKPVKGLDYRTV